MLGLTSGELTLFALWSSRWFRRASGRPPGRGSPNAWEGAPTIPRSLRARKAPTRLRLSPPVVPDPPAGSETGSSSPGSSSDVGALIFVSDASAEAERLISALRARGYQVVDVPLGLLVNRVSVQRPALILCDADAPGAVESVERIH